MRAIGFEGQRGGQPAPPPIGDKRDPCETLVGTCLACHTGVLLAGLDDRSALKHGPRYLRWGLMEAAIHASSHPLYKERYQRTKRRLGRQRGAKVAQI